MTERTSVMDEWAWAVREIQDAREAANAVGVPDSMRISFQVAVGRLEQNMRDDVVRTLQRAQNDARNLRHLAELSAATPPEKQSVGEGA